MEKFNEQDFAYILVLHVCICSLLPLLNVILKYNIGEIYLQTRQVYTKEILLSASFQVPFITSKGIFYPMIGYYLDKRTETKEFNRKGVSIILLVALGIGGGCIYYDGVHSEFSQLYIEMLDYVIAIGIFILMKDIFTNQINCKKYPTICAIISRLGGLTLGMYFFDDILHVMLYRRLEAYMRLPVAVYSLIWCVVNLSIGGICTYLFKEKILKRKNLL